MRILLTGANGLLGQHLVQKLLNAGHHVTATGRGPSRLDFASPGQFKYLEADITDSPQIKNLMEEERPQVVIHGAAMTQVDQCEGSPGLCSAINIGGTANLLRYAVPQECFFIYVSTDFVFDGLIGNYREEDLPGPINHYGHTKLQAEKIVSDAGIPWAIVRTCLVYGNTLFGTRSNIITWVKEKLEKKENIKVVNDQLRTPTYIGDLARGIVLLVEKKATGIFHISGEEERTPYQMAIATADYFGLDKNLVEKVTADNFSQPANRPLKTGFCIEKAKNILGYRPISFNEGLQRVARGTDMEN
jgi:dTDP-4-dehydrorhamnose reductase